MTVNISRSLSDIAGESYAIWHEHWQAGPIDIRIKKFF